MLTFWQSVSILPKLCFFNPVSQFMIYKNTRRLAILSLALASALFAEDAAEAETPEEAVAPEAMEMEQPAEEMSAPEPMQLSEDELNQMLGYLTALGGGVASLQLDEAQVAEIADGLHKALSGELEIMALPQAEVEMAFAEAQARVEALQAEAEEVPGFSEGSLEKIGVVMYAQAGVQELGFGAEEADAIKKGFIDGATASEIDPTLEAKMPAFQAFIQDRMQRAQAAMMVEQAKAREAAMAEFKPISEEWRQKENMNVVLETTQGDIEIELYPKLAPLAVANFVGHIENGYYEGLTFHRVIEGFMIQGGDPLGSGAGGESIWGKPFPDEFSDELRFDQKGLLAMANSGPMTNGSQFFITTINKNPEPGQPPFPVWLNDKHTIFGKVVAGYENVEKIEDTEVGAQDKPVEEQKILKAYVKK
jgi:peptidylprolyl isomerase